MNFTGEIGINYALQELKESGQAFTLVFVRANDKGKKAFQGEICIVARAVYGGEKRVFGSENEYKTYQHERTEADAPRIRYDDEGLLPLSDLEKESGEQFFTVLISHIVGYNGLKVKH